MSNTGTKLPRQLQEQIENAKALMGVATEEIAETPAGNTGDDPTPKASVEIDVQQTNEDGNTDVESTPAVEETQDQVAEAEPEKHEIVDQNEETWQHKYSVLYGKYQAEVPRLQRQVNELRKKLEDQAQKPQATQVETPQATAAPSTEITDDMVRANISPEMIEEWGIDYWKQVIKAQRAFVPQQPQVKTDDALNQRLADLEARDFYSELSALVPDISELDRDQKCIEWLQTVEPLSGRTYHRLLHDAESNMDSIRAAAIFDQYKSVRGMTKPAAQEPLAKKQAVKTPSVKSQVAPDGQPTIVKPAGKTMQLSEWLSKKQAVARLAPTNPVEAGQLKKQLDTALSEGRVIDEDGKPVSYRS